MVILAGCAEPEIQDLRQFVAAKKASSPGKPLEPLPKVEPYTPFEYTAEGLKDPFATSAFVQEAVVEPPPPIDNGIRPDADRPREELEKYALGSLAMVGSFQNTEYEEGNIWALIKAPDGIIHRVKEGNYLGANHGQIILITEQRIDLQEIVPDGNRGWREREAFLSLAE